MTFDAHKHMARLAGYNDTPEKILAAAIDVLEEYGWTQGSLQDGEGVCSLGALNIASHGDAKGRYAAAQPPEWREAYNRLSAAAGQNATTVGVPCWQDGENVTQEDVTLAFKRALSGDYDPELYETARMNSIREMQAKSFEPQEFWEGMN